MAPKLTIRQLLLSILAVRYDVSQKEMGAAAGLPQKSVSQYLRRAEPKGEAFDRLLATIPCPPAAVPIVTACLEALEALEADGGLMQEERAVVEEAALTVAGMIRETLAEAVRLSRASPSPEDLSSVDAAFSRQRAGEHWLRLKELSAEERLAVVRVAEELQTWALCEKVCEESATEASRNLERAAGLALLAQEIAQRVQGPKAWLVRLRGYAAAHAANVLRVSGDLKGADAGFEEAKRLWHSGSDPASLLDPGRLLDLEASLRRGQRRLEEALALLEEAIAVGHSPARALIKKGFTLEVMGEPELAIEALLQAEGRLELQGDRRLMNILRCNLGFSFCNVGRFAQAAGLARQVREVALDMGDEILVLRVTWLEGRIAAGVGRPEEARKLLEQARREFSARGMGYDVALALLEEAILLLDEGRVDEVKELTRGLAEVFESREVHREALAALRLFQEAAARETATAELARRVLRYLVRTRHDQGLPFES